MPTKLVPVSLVEAIAAAFAHPARRHPRRIDARWHFPASGDPYVAAVAPGIVSRYPHMLRRRAFQHGFGNGRWRSLRHIHGPGRCGGCSSRGCGAGSGRDYDGSGGGGNHGTGRRWWRRGYDMRVGLGDAAGQQGDQAGTQDGGDVNRRSRGGGQVYGFHTPGIYAEAGSPTSGPLWMPPTGKGEEAA